MRRMLMTRAMMATISCAMPMKSPIGDGSLQSVPYAFKSRETSNHLRGFSLD